MTVAMYLAKNKIDIPEAWKHDPNIKSKKDTTVAMLMAYRGMIPPEEWYHKPTLYS